MTFTYSFFWPIAQATSTDEEIVPLIEFLQQNFVSYYLHLPYQTKFLKFCNFVLYLISIEIYLLLCIHSYLKRIS